MASQRTEDVVFVADVVLYARHGPSMAIPATIEQASLPWHPKRPKMLMSYQIKILATARLSLDSNEEVRVRLDALDAYEVFPWRPISALSVRYKQHGVNFNDHFRKNLHPRISIQTNLAIHNRPRYPRKTAPSEPTNHCVLRVDLEPIARRTNGDKL